jgi:ribosomal protein S18 acetylase RimI-like enzyme
VGGLNAAVDVAGPDDVPRVVASLARAFEDDPIFDYLLPPGKHLARIQGYFTAALKVQHLDHGLCFTTTDRSAAALWDPPKEWKMTVGQIARGGRWLFPAFGRYIPKALRALSMMEKVHPSEPHYYLAVLGTHPAQQGKGLGSAVLQPVLQRCDAELMPAYLESSKASNIPFYERHGFKVTGEIALPNGPSLWPMWRDPQPA